MTARATLSAGKAAEPGGAGSRCACVVSVLRAGMPLSTSRRVRGCPQRFVAPARSARSCIACVRTAGGCAVHVQRAAESNCHSKAGPTPPTLPEDGCASSPRSTGTLAPVARRAATAALSRAGGPGHASGMTRCCVTGLCSWRGPAQGGGAILPLEIRWFDASLASVYRAAGDLAFSGDAFEQSHGD